MYFHFINESARNDRVTDALLRSGIKPRRRFPWNHQGFLRWTAESQRSLEWQLCLFHEAHTSLGFEIKPRGFMLAVPWVFALFVTLPFTIWPWKRCQIRFSDWALCWTFGVDAFATYPIRDAKGNRVRWRDGSFDILRFLFGDRYLVSKTTLHEQATIVPMPEGPYPAQATFVHSVYARRRWRRWPFRDEYCTHTIRCDIGIPFEGKGENDWDCGEDALYESSCECSALSTAVVEFAKSVLNYRARYGNAEPGAYPHPRVRQRAVIERRLRAERERANQQPPQMEVDG